MIFTKIACYIRWVLISQKDSDLWDVPLKWCLSYWKPWKNWQNSSHFLIRAFYFNGTLKKWFKKRFRTARHKSKTVTLVCKTYFSGILQLIRVKLCAKSQICILKVGWYSTNSSHWGALILSDSQDNLLITVRATYIISI